MKKQTLIFPLFLCGGHIYAFVLHGKYQASRPFSGPRATIASVYSFMSFGDKTAPKGVNPQQGLPAVQGRRTL